MSHLHVYCVAAFLAFATPALALDRTAPAGLPEVVTLDRALSLLRERSPQSLAERARAQVVAAERVEASVHPNPTLSYGGVALAHGVNTGAAYQHQFVLEQPLLLFGQRKARQAAAELKLGPERARFNADLSARGLEVRRAFTELVASQKRVELLAAELSELEQVEKIVRGRQAAGDRSLYDLTRLEVEQDTAGVELQAAKTAT